MCFMFISAILSSCQWKCLDGVFTVMVRSTLGLKGTIHLKEDILKANWSIVILTLH